MRLGEAGDSLDSRCFLGFVMPQSSSPPNAVSAALLWPALSLVLRGAS